MNVNVLDPPPPWWWYLPIAAGTMFLTVTVWIIFKRNETVGFPPPHSCFSCWFTGWALTTAGWV